MTRALHGSDKQISHVLSCLTLSLDMSHQPNLNADSLRPSSAMFPATLCCMMQIFETREMLGLYGRSPTSFGNYYVATGDCGHILTGGTLAGMIISGW